MPEIVDESLAIRLVEWGADTVFGLPGDGINGLMEGFRRQRENLRFVLVHQEEGGGVHGVQLPYPARPERRPPAVRCLHVLPVCGQGGSA
ncbi:thiamine pyrophosphate-binding protein [Nonomuraea sp. NPDC004702]